jgi:hypothetical protein
VTIAPGDLKAFRTNVMLETGLTDPVSVGIVGDDRHAASGGYHISGDDINRAGRYGTDYSTRRNRDRFLPNPYASAVDIGDDWPRGGRNAWIRFSNLLVSHLMAGDPALAAVRAVNYSPDGRQCKRYDTANRSSGIINSTDTVTVHTHIEWWRDTAGQAVRATSLAAILGYVRTARDHTNDLKGDEVGTLTAPDGHEGDVYFTLTAVPTPENTRVAAHVALSRLMADVATIKAQTARTVDMGALAAALAPLLSVSKDAVVAAMQDPEVQQVIYQQSFNADQASENS